MSANPIALTDGNWRPVGGVLKWFPTLTSAPEPPPFDPDEIACHCGATVITSCRSASGGSRKSHEHRVPRRCPCGGELKPRRSLCHACAYANELEAKRTYNRRLAAS